MKLPVSAAVGSATLAIALLVMLAPALADAFKPASKRGQVVTRSAGKTASQGKTPSSRKAAKAGKAGKVASSGSPTASVKGTKGTKSEPAQAARLFDSRKLEGTGTMLLDDIMGLIGQSPRLRDEVRAALAEIKKTPQDITCIGRRIDGRWRHLGGARVQPYSCQIGARWLEIQADLQVRGKDGESYAIVSDVAMKNARSTKETNPRWSWTDQKPKDWFLE